MAQISLQGKMETKLIDGKAIAALVTTLVQEVLLAMSNGFENPWNILRSLQLAWVSKEFSHWISLKGYWNHWHGGLFFYKPFPIWGASRSQGLDSPLAENNHVAT